jgi:hypothetical protein
MSRQAISATVVEDDKLVDATKAKCATYNLKNPLKHTAGGELYNTIVSFSTNVDSRCSVSLLRYL